MARIRGLRTVALVSGFWFTFLLLTSCNNTPSKLQSGPQTVSSLKMFAVTNPLAGTCVGIQLMAVTSDSQPLKVAASGGTLTGATIYSDANCKTPATTLTVPSGFNSVVFYLQDTKAETLNLAAVLSGLGVTLGLTIQPAAPSRFFLTGPSSISAGVCTPVQIQTQDPFGNQSAVVAKVTASLTPQGKAVFSTSLSNCSSGTTVSQVAIPAGQSQVTVYVYDPKPEPITLGVSDTATTSPLTAFAMNNETVVPGPAAKLSISLVSPQLVAGACTEFSVNVTDSVGNLTNSSSSLSVAVSGIPIFSDPTTCNSSASTVGIASGSSAQNFYVKDLTAESLSLSASGGGLSTAQAFSFTVQPAAASQLELTGPTSISSGVLTQFTVEELDAFGNASPLATDVTVTLTPTGSALLIGDLISYAQITTLTIPANAGSASFYVADGTLEKISLTVSATGLAGDTLNGETIVVGPPSSLSPNISNPIIANYCNPITANIADGGGNPTNVSADFVVGLTDTQGHGNYYQDSGCSQTPITQVIIKKGYSSSAPYYFKDPLYENLPGAVYTLIDVNKVITCTPTKPCAQNTAGGIGVIPGPNISGILPPQFPVGKQGTNQCVGPIVVATYPAGSGTLVDYPINFKVTGSAQVFSAAGCPSNSLLNNSPNNNPILIPAGTSSAGFYMQDSVSEPVNVSITPVSFGSSGSSASESQIYF